MRGWSQERLGFEAGIHRTYISDLERGARNPSILLLEKLAGPLGVAASVLIADPSQSARLGSGQLQIPV
jgi:transcriptional regulator with XRE-family HTH domain